MSQLLLAMDICEKNTVMELYASMSGISRLVSKRACKVRRVLCLKLHVLLFDILTHSILQDRTWAGNQQFLGFLTNRVKGSIDSEQQKMGWFLVLFSALLFCLFFLPSKPKAFLKSLQRKTNLNKL